MNYYSFSKIFLPLLMLSYFGVSVSLGPYPTEIPFPFFSWFLFSAPPSRMRELPTIRVLAAAGNTLATPVLLSRAQQFVDLKGNGPTVLEAVIGRLTDSVRRGNREEILTHRKTLESYFLSPRVTYEVVLAKYDLIEYVRNGKIRNVKTLATFTTDDTP